MGSFSYNDILKLRRPTNYYSKEEIETAVRNPALIHYTTNMKTVRPWYSNTNHPFAEEFRKYLDDSPWKDKQMGEMVFHAKEAKIISLVEKLPRNLSLQVLGWLGEKTFGVRRIL